MGKAACTSPAAVSGGGTHAFTCAMLQDRYPAIDDDHGWKMRSSVGMNAMKC